MRPFERWVTQYYQILLNFSKFGLGEYTENPRFLVFKPEQLRNIQAFL